MTPNSGFRADLGVRAAAAQLDLAVVVHAVRVGEDAAARDDEAAARAAELALALPGEAVVGLAVHAEHLRPAM